jgi:subtilisin family serine protease
MRIPLLLLTFTASIASHAQTTLTGNLQEEPSKIHATVKDAVFVIRQDYYIRDTTDPARKALGLNKKPYFGRFYYLALNIEGCLVTDAAVRTPWLHDPNFTMVRDSANYVPELGASSYRRLSDTVFQNKGFGSVDTFSYFIDLHDSTLAVISVPVHQGLRLDTLADERADTAMWFWTLKVKGQTADRQNVYFDTIPSVGYEVQKGRYSPKLGSYVTKNYYTSSSAIGGLVLSTHPTLGRMDFQVHGIIVRKPKGKFDFKRLRAGRSDNRSKGKTIPSNESKPPDKVVITHIESKE